MKPQKSHARLVILALLLALMPGCVLLDPTGASSNKTAGFAPPTARWTTSMGQVQYVSPARSLIGEAIVSRLGAEQQFQFDFLLGPGVPAMRLRVDGDRAAAEGLFARGSWSGLASKPGRMAQWLALREIFLAADAGQATVQSAPGSPALWTATAIYAKGAKGKRLQRLTVQFSQSNDRLTFVFGQ